MPVVTITTDFGTKDGFVATMKGVILGICPSAQIVDISHEVSPQNIREGAFVLWRAYLFFPSGTVHLAVVDPGVGTSRRPMAARVGDQFFVGPDNGLFTLIYEDASRHGWAMDLVHLTNNKYFLTEISNTFHGRDVFAPVAAHLANGVRLNDLGPLISEPVRIFMQKPEKTTVGWLAHITNVDVFGNCTTDLPGSAVIGQKNVAFHFHGREVHGLVTSYGQRNPGELVALVDSEGYLELAIVNGSASLLLNAKTGDVVEVFLD